MEFEINRDFLFDAISFVSKLQFLKLSKTDSLYKSICLNVEQEKIKFSSFDPDLFCNINLHINSIKETGKTYLSTKMLFEIVSKLPNDTVFFKRENNNIKIKCKKSSFSLPILNINKEYEESEDFQKDVSFSSKSFSSSVQKIALAASKEDSTPIITGINMHFVDDALYLYATDRYRIAKNKIKCNFSNNIDSSFVISSKVLSEISRSFYGCSELNVSFNQNNTITFFDTNKNVTCTGIAGNYPIVEKLFTDANIISYALLNSIDFIDAIKRLQPVLGAEKPIKFTFKKSEVLMEAKGEDTMGVEILDTVMTGEETTLSFKPQFLIDGISSAEGEFVKIGFTKGRIEGRPGPAVITKIESLEKHQDVGEFKYLVQPNLLL